MRNVDTPFRNENHNKADACKPTKPNCDCVYCPWCRNAIPVNDHYRQVPNPTAKPEKDESVSQEDACGEDKGLLAPIAARVLMKILYAARVARYDLLRAVSHLACYLTKWTSECDARLHQIVCYINSTLSHRLVGWVGDDLGSVQPHLYADADFAGCTGSQKSTSGVHHFLRGPNTCFPIHGVSKRQSCVSVSTPEAEIVCGFYAMKTVGLPSLPIWEKILPGNVQLCVHEDSQAMIRVCHTGQNPTMRYLGRVHRISIAWLHWVFGEENIDLKYTVSKLMAADIYTKAFTDADKWKAACALINIGNPSDLQDLLSQSLIQEENETNIDAKDVLKGTQSSSTDMDTLVSDQMSFDDPLYTSRAVGGTCVVKHNPAPALPVVNVLGSNKLGLPHDPDYDRFLHSAHNIATSCPGHKPFKDYWLCDGRHWYLHHIIPRDSLATPCDHKDGPDISTLEKCPQTTLHKANGATITLKDYWKLPQDEPHDFIHHSFPFKWIGVTAFKIKRRYRDSDQCTHGFDVDFPSRDSTDYRPIACTCESKPIVLKVKKLSDKATLPQRGSEGSAGLDLYASQPEVILPWAGHLVKTEIAIATPAGTYGRVAPRSGLAVKHQIHVGAGVIDSDYTGEIKVLLINNSNTEFRVAKGDRVAQLIIEKYEHCPIQEVSDLDNTTRGQNGFGSTGVSERPHSTNANTTTPLASRHANSPGSLNARSFDIPAHVRDTTLSQFEYLSDDDASTSMEHVCQLMTHNECSHNTSPQLWYNLSQDLQPFSKLLSTHGEGPVNNVEKRMVNNAIRPIMQYIDNKPHLRNTNNFNHLGVLCNSEDVETSYLTERGYFGGSILLFLGDTDFIGKENKPFMCIGYADDLRYTSITPPDNWNILIVLKHELRDSKRARKRNEKHIRRKEGQPSLCMSPRSPDAIASSTKTPKFNRTLVEVCTGEHS